MGVVNLAHVDTTPGAGGAFAPPAAGVLSADDYMELMRHRYGEDVEYYQQMVLAAKRAHLAQFSVTGPFAEQARQILRAIRNKPKVAQT